FLVRERQLSSRLGPDWKANGPSGAFSPIRRAISHWLQSTETARSLGHNRLAQLGRVGMWAVAGRPSISVGALSFGDASPARPRLRFHIPLIEPDMAISRIRLSDKTSRLRPQLAAPTRGQAYETIRP